MIHYINEDPLYDKDIIKIFDHIDSEYLDIFKIRKKRTTKFQNRDKLIVMLILFTKIKFADILKINKSGLNLIKNTLEICDYDGEYIDTINISCFVPYFSAWLNDRRRILKRQEDAIFISYGGTRLSCSGMTKIIERITYYAIDHAYTPERLRYLYNLGALLQHKSLSLLKIKLTDLCKTNSKKWELLVNTKISDIEWGEACALDWLYYNSDIETIGELATKYSELSNEKDVSELLCKLISLVDHLKTCGYIESPTKCEI